MFNEQEEIAKTRIPQEGEILGIVIAILGGGRMTVECSDGNTRMCRIPGKLRRRVWVKNHDLVIIKPWVVQSNERADIVWRYTRTQASWLKKKGYIKNLNTD